MKTTTIRGYFPQPKFESVGKFLTISTVASTLAWLRIAAIKPPVNCMSTCNALHLYKANVTIIIDVIILLQPLLPRRSCFGCCWRWVLILALPEPNLPLTSIAVCHFKFRSVGCQTKTEMCTLVFYRIVLVKQTVRTFDCSYPTDDDPNTCL